MKYKISLLALLIISLILFAFKTKSEVQITGNTAMHLKQNNPKQDLNGIWGLSNYFDTILTHKKLAEYRLQSPTWFGIMIEIKEDCLRTFGSIEQNEYSFEIKGDTLTNLFSYVTGYNWVLVQKGEELHLIPLSKENKDSTIYIYRKRNDLNCLMSSTNQDLYTIGNNVTDFFNRALFAGKYIDKATNKEVVFTEDGGLLGIDDFNKYEVRNYFGTSHPYYNQDVIYLSDGDKEYKDYNWVFSGEELVLTEFVNEIVSDEDGHSYEGDFYVLGEEKIILQLLKTLS